MTPALAFYYLSDDVDLAEPLENPVGLHREAAETSPKVFAREKEVWRGMCLRIANRQRVAESESGTLLVTSTKVVSHLFVH